MYSNNNRIRTAGGYEVVDTRHSCQLSAVYFRAEERISAKSL